LQIAQVNSQTKNCKRACLSATADFTGTKKLNLSKPEKKEMTKLEIISQTNDRQERPVGNKG